MIDSFIQKKKVLYTLYNTNKVGGPNVSMQNVADSYLKSFFCFKSIVIDDRLGIFPKFKVIKRLIKEIRNFCPDVIYVSGLQLHGFYMILASKLAGFKNKTITIVHGSACDSLNIGKLKKFIFAKILEPYTIKNSFIVYTVCKEMAERRFIKKYSKHFGGVIHNAAPDWPVNNGVHTLNIRELINADKEDVLFVYTGRVHREKGIGYLLDAFKTIEGHAKLIIVGDGSDYEKYINYQKQDENLTKKVYFLGKKNDIKGILEQSDVFVFPSLHENLPNSIVEACKIGLPVISTNVGGIPEIIENEKEGLLVKPYNSEEIKNAINFLLANPKLIKEYGKNAKKKVDTYFSKEFLYPKIQLLFEQVINQEER